jgi:PAS domain S-box-containing protein
MLDINLTEDTSLPYLQGFTILEPVDTNAHTQVFRAKRKDDSSTYLITVVKAEAAGPHLPTAEHFCSEELLQKVLTSDERLRKQNLAFRDLASSDLLEKDLLEDIQIICCKTAQTLEAGRVGVWFYNADYSVLDCQGLYELDKNKFSTGYQLNITDFPEYWQTLQHREMVIVSDTSHMPVSDAMCSMYLQPFHIGAFLLVPIHIGTRIVGIFSVENMEVPRHWQLEEQNFAGSMADMVTISISAQERKEAEARIRQQEQFYKCMLENAFDGILVKDANGFIKYATPSVRQFGCDPEEVMGMDGMDFFHPKELDQMRSTMQEMHCTPGAVHRGFHQIKFKNGGYRSIEVIVRNMLHDPDIQGVVINFRDITDKQMAELELAQKEKYFRTLVENTFDVTFTRDPSGVITYISPSVERVLGYTPDELIGKAVPFLIHPDCMETVVHDAQEISLQPDKVMHSELKLIRKDGKVVHVESIAKNLLHDELVQGYLITFRDISEQKEAENQLLQRERYFRSLIENSTDIISISDQHSNFFYASPSIEKVLGYSSEEYYSLSGRELVHPDYCQQVNQTFASIANQPGTLAKEEFLFRHKDGHYVFLEGIFKNMLHDEAVQGIVMNCRDITERKKVEAVLRDYNETLQKEVKKQTDSLVTKNNELEKILHDLQHAQMQLVESEKMASLGQLTAGIAHEINNPINFVSANIEPLKTDFEDIKLLLNKYASLHDSPHLQNELAEINRIREEIDISYLEEEISALLNGIEEGATRTKEIVVGLRNFSRLDEIDLKYANINEGLSSTLMLLQNKFKTRITIIKDYGDIPDIECFPGKLNQVFMNILSNAFSAIPGEGTITIRTWQEDKYVKVSIQDTGTGMTEKVKNRIFEPFFTTKDVGEGTGLGLSISYGIIQRHNGKIEVSSKVGKGSTFVITLPIRLEK